MSLVFATICPHSPALMPNIAKENQIKLTATLNAYKHMEEKLYLIRPDTLVVISPHSNITPDAFTINLSSEYNCDFEKFGDHETKLTFVPDIELINGIKQDLSENFSINFISEDKIDYGSAIPLYHLTKNIGNIKIAPISISLDDYKKHYTFGTMLGKILKKSKQRIGVIASGDLSHRLLPVSPAGYSPLGKKFDKKIISLINKKKLDKIVSLKQNFVDEAKECGMRSIIILLSLLEDTNYQPELISYEGPFGIGYAVYDFVLNN